MTRRDVFAALLCLSMALPAIAAPSRGAQLDGSLYSRALEASIDRIIKDWGEFRDTDTTRVLTDWKNIVVQAFPEITVNMPGHVGETHVEYLDEEGLISWYKRVKKPFRIFQIHPMVTEGTRVKVWFSLAWFRYDQRVIPFFYRRRNLTFSYSEFSTVYFRLDQETRQYVVDEVKLGGI